MLSVVYCLTFISKNQFEQTGILHNVVVIMMKEEATSLQLFGLRKLHVLMGFFSELCWGEAMVAYAKPQQRKKAKAQRRERDKTLFIDLGFERWQLRFRKARGGQDVP